MSYVDGFVVPISKDKIVEYWRIAELTAEVWREHGALEYYECVVDERDEQHRHSFPTGIAAKDGETVVLAWIVYESREHRDEVNAKVMSDPRITAFEGQEMPFDCMRILHGGFNMVVKA